MITPLWNTVTYAGFIGSVTGMNAERVSIGEMGGRGMGHWDGTPMALLVRAHRAGSGGGSVHSAANVGALDRRVPSTSIW